MKQNLKKITALLCVFALLFSHAYGAFENWSWGQVSSSSQSIVAPDTRYSSVAFATSKGPQMAHVLEFRPQNPNLTLRAGLSNGYVYGSQTVLGMANALEEEYPNQVVAAVNADFFNFGDGVPFGIMLDEGELLTTPPDYSKAFVVREDGSAFIISHGTMMNRILELRGTLQQLTGVNIPHSAANSLVLYNHRYATSTKAAKDSAEAVCELVSGEFRDGETLSLRVLTVNTDLGNTPLNEGQVVLSGVGSYKELVSSLNPDEEFSVRFQFVDAWKDARFAVAGNQVILKDGEIQDVSDGSNAPRTAVGIKEDGSVVFLTLDGRQKDYAAGGSFQNVATILRDLGCVDALNLDGGGSTTFVLRPVGEFERKIMNKPSGGSARRVANAIVLINTAPEGEVTNLLIKSHKRTLLVGGTYTGYADKLFAVDANYQPKAVMLPALFALDPEYGTIDAAGNLTPTAPGEVTISVMAGGLENSISASFIDQVSEIKSTLTELTLDISASETIPVTLWNGNTPVEFLRSQLSWAVEGDVGSITPNGEFTASELAGKGEIVITQGEVSLRIPVTVKGPTYESSFEDLGEHLWATDAINRLVEAGIVSGTSKTTFAPAKPITRADFMLLLVRMMQLDPSIGADATFTDVPPDAYYASALGAAKTLGIAQGSASGEFFPTRSITREEMFTLIYRVMQKMGSIADDAPESALSVFSDAAAISAYAKTPIATLAQSGLISGNASRQANPKGNATRAEAAVMIDRVRTVTGGSAL